MEAVVTLKMTVGIVLKTGELMGSKLTKTDELMLKGDEKGAIRLMLKQVRATRTAAHNVLSDIDVAHRKWPNEGVIERAHQREMLEHVIERSNENELELLSALKQFS